VIEIAPVTFNIIETEEPEGPPPVEEPPPEEISKPPVLPENAPEKILIPAENEETIIAADEKSILEVPKDSALIWEEYIDDYFKSYTPVPRLGNFSRIMEFEATDVLESSKDSSEKMMEIMRENLDKIVYSPGELKDVAPPRSDIAGDYIRDKYSTPMVPLSALIGMGAKLASKLVGKLFGGGDDDAAAILDLSFDEIDIMKIIWGRGRATALEIYERLPRGTPIRMARLNLLLQQLTAKKIIVTKERQYENIYFPNVSKERVIDYYMVYLSDLNSRSEAEQREYNLEDYKNVLRQKIRKISID